MENKSTNNKDKYFIFPQKILFNNEFSLDTNQQNHYNFGIGIINEINSNENSSLFTNEHLINEFTFIKHEDIITESISKDTLNATKIGPKDNKSIINIEKNKEDKEEILERNNYSLGFFFFSSVEQKK